MYSQYDGGKVGMELGENGTSAQSAKVPPATSYTFALFSTALLKTSISFSQCDPGGGLVPGLQRGAARPRARGGVVGGPLRSG